MWGRIRCLWLAVGTLVVELSLNIASLPAVRAEATPPAATPAVTIVARTEATGGGTSVSMAQIQARQTLIDFLHSVDICVQKFRLANGLCLPVCVFVPATERPNNRMGVANRLSPCYLFVP
ncbi:MAG TPA: hypothetical protein VMT34_18060 [Aggregatilineales bacterium]|nr:hypothetical protein [Aggregatilineales bacterium]